MLAKSTEPRSSATTYTVTLLIFFMCSFWKQEQLGRDTGTVKLIEWH